jgi:hypothetical protein
MPMSEALEEARKLGYENGRGEASWAFDDRITEPSLSGDYTARDLMDEIGLDYDLTPTEETDQIADAYTEAARDAFRAEVEKTAKARKPGNEHGRNAASWVLTGPIRKASENGSRSGGYPS